MADAHNTIYAEPEEILQNTIGPADDADSADLSWKEYNLLSLGIPNVFHARLRLTDQIHRQMVVVFVATGAFWL
jgi:hypothetical protein